MTTECESLELELLRREVEAAERMYELELEAVTQTYVANTQTEGAILLSLIFGYLMVAHFVGDELSRIQTAILNGLYLLTVTAGISVYAGHYQSIVFAVDRMMATGSISPEDIPITGTPGGVLVVTIAYTSMIIASLYFMWTVRHPKEL